MINSLSLMINMSFIYLLFFLCNCTCMLNKTCLCLCLCLFYMVVGINPRCREDNDFMDCHLILLKLRHWLPWPPPWFTCWCVVFSWYLQCGCPIPLSMIRIHSSACDCHWYLVKTLLWTIADSVALPFPFGRWPTESVQKMSLFQMWNRTKILCFSIYQYRLISSMVVSLRLLTNGSQCSDDKTRYKSHFSMSLSVLQDLPGKQNCRAKCRCANQKTALTSNGTAKKQWTSYERV